ncbi:beta-ketothiolase BktB [Terrarubrum flagellatum]|uniref:beta-ketothiolase BktB n=1 Tax=Terrirubrum flagellatum TaxID=2895980 RepID=UPI003144D727
MSGVVILEGVRTAIGGFQGSLSAKPPTELGAIVVREALKRADVAGDQVGHVVFGQVIVTEPKDAYMARVAGINGGVPKEVPALTVNRLCGSSIQAVISAAQSIMLGDADVAVAGGAESMSRAPHATQMLRSGVKMGETTFVDMLTGTLADPFQGFHMGVTAENVARQHQITRAEQDAFAVESQKRAAAAIADKRFASQIVGVEVKRGRDMVAFDTDEHPKANTTLEGLSSLRAVFQKDGTVTAGNASGINDGAAAVVLMSAERAARENRKPMAKILGYGHAGVDPAVMGIGPVPAVRNLLAKTGLKIEDFDVIESNEAFASQACAVTKELGFAPDRVNPNGGAIALGHPVGATGAIILVKALHELKRVGGKRALCTMCIGGGQGIAIAIERLN